MKRTVTPWPWQCLFLRMMIHSHRQMIRNSSWLCRNVDCKLSVVFSRTLMRERHISNIKIYSAIYIYIYIYNCSVDLRLGTSLHISVQNHITHTHAHVMPIDTYLSGYTGYMHGSKSITVEVQFRQIHRQCMCRYYLARPMFLPMDWHDPSQRGSLSGVPGPKRMLISWINPGSYETWESINKGIIRQEPTWCECW